MKGTLGVGFQWYWGVQTKFHVFLTLLIFFNFTFVQQEKFTRVAEHHQIPMSFRPMAIKCFSPIDLFVQKLDRVRCWMSATCWSRRVIPLSLLVDKMSTTSYVFCTQNVLSLVNNLHTKVLRVSMLLSPSNITYANYAKISWQDSLS